MADRLAELTDFGVDAGDVHYATQELAEQDWAENWKNIMNQRVSAMIWQSFQVGPIMKLARVRK